MKTIASLFLLIIIFCNNVTAGDFVVRVLDKQNLEYVDLSISTTVHEATITNVKCLSSYDYGVINLIVPDKVIDDYDYEYEVTGIGDNAFSAELNIENLSIKTIELPKTLKRIGDKAFSSLLNMESIIIPEGIESIGESAFANCTKLIGLWIPKSISNVSSLCNGGMDMNEFKNLFLGDNITSIESLAFTRCKKLENVYIPTVEPPTIYKVFPANVTFYVPQESIEKYREKWEREVENPTFLPYQVSGLVNVVKETNNLNIEMTDKSIIVSGQALEWVRIIDIKGLEVQSQIGNEFQTDLPEGIYIVQTNIGNQKICIK